MKGSHIVVPKLFEHGFPYIFQNPDGRIVFAIPYEDDFTLIGTTDVDFEDDPGQVSISDAEVTYLCTAVNAYFKRKIGPDDVVWSYSGVRPLYDDEAESASSATRDYVLEVDHGDSRAPLLSVFGGKITTFRRLAEQAMEKLGEVMGPLGDPWTAGQPLPGGDIPDADFEGYLERFHAAHGWLPAPLARRYLRAYGTRTARLLDGAASLADLGEDLGDGIYEAELRYVVRAEWVETADDLLWRRSRLGLHISDDTRRNVEAWLDRNRAAAERQESA